jgi:ribosome-binding factor A
MIRHEISKLLLEQANDPRLSGFISVTRVSTSPDLKQAKIYVSVLADKTERKDILQGFKSAAGFFRKELASRLTLRYVPELSFEIDDSIEQGARILKLIEQVKTEGTPDEH